MGPDMSKEEINPHNLGLVLSFKWFLDDVLMTANISSNWEIENNEFKHQKKNVRDSSSSFSLLVMVDSGTLAIYTCREFFWQTTNKFSRKFKKLI